MIIGNTRSGTALFFVHSEQQPNFLKSFFTQELSCKDLCRNDALRIAGPTTVDIFGVFCRGQKWWHRIHMSGENYSRSRLSSCDDIVTILFYELTIHFKTELTQTGGDKFSHRAFVAGYGWDIDEFS